MWAPERLRVARRVVDLGFGAAPWTTLEWAEVLGPGVDVIGVELDPEVVARARAAAPPGVRFLTGSFDLPDEARGADVVRALNVLRDYGPEDVWPAHLRLGAALAEGGVLVEGTCGPRGEVGAVWLSRREGDALVRDALLFWTDFSRGFAPLVFRDRLPRDLRGAVRPGTAVHAWFAAWTDAYEQVRGASTEPARRFVAAAEHLAARRDDVPVAPALWAAGALVWRADGRRSTLNP